VYESFYKLRVSPFQLTPDPLFFYDSDTHRHGLIKLRQAMRDGCSITAVTGEPGTGKTELMRKFINELESSNTVIANIPLTSLRANNILDYIATAFGVVNMGFVGDALWSKAAFLGKIQQQISTQVSEGKKYIVFVDNAESLSKSCLDKIMQLCSVRIQGAPLVQCFLFGDSSIVRNLKLDVTHLGINTISSVKLGTLGERETLRYIEHRLIEAGWQGDPEITELAYKLIYDISEGVPWHINLLCHRIFLQSFLEDAHVIDENIVGMFLTEKQFASMEVCGSDVAVKSNVVTLKTAGSGRETKGTSFFPETHSHNSGRSQQVLVEERDSISHFFSEPTGAKIESQIDDATISLDAVQEAFEASIEDEAGSDNLYEDDIANEDLFTEFNDAENGTEIPGHGVQASRVQSEIYRPAGGGIKRDSVLDRILPKIKSGYEELTQSLQKEKSRNSIHQYRQYVKTYPALDIPVTITPQGNVAANVEVATVEAPEQLDTFESKSSFQIATRASIVTSLAITLVMWVISDTRTGDTRLVRSFENTVPANTISRKIDIPVNTATPSPFEQRDDLSRSRLILKK